MMDPSCLAPALQVHISAALSLRTPRPKALPGSIRKHIHTAGPHPVTRVTWLFPGARHDSSPLVLMAQDHIVPAASSLLRFCSSCYH